MFASFKKFLKAGMLVAALALGTGVAKADSISFFGTDTFNTSTQTINFVTSYVGVGGTGILSPFTASSTAVFTPSFNYSLGTKNALLFTVTAPTGAVLTYTVNSVDTLIDTLEIIGTGTYRITNGSAAPITAMGRFDLTTQGTGALTTFSDLNMTAATPEPNSLMLLGTGFVSAAGMLIRRRKMMAS